MTDIKKCQKNCACHASSLDSLLIVLLIGN